MWSAKRGGHAREWGDGTISHPHSRTAKTRPRCQASPNFCSPENGVWSLPRAAPAGTISAACTDLAGSSAWFERGFVTYSNDAKMELWAWKNAFYGVRVPCARELPKPWHSVPSRSRVRRLRLRSQEWLAPREEARPSLWTVRFWICHSGAGVDRKVPFRWRPRGSAFSDRAPRHSPAHCTAAKRRSLNGKNQLLYCYSNNSIIYAELQGFLPTNP